MRSPAAFGWSTDPMMIMIWRHVTSACAWQWKFHSLPPALLPSCWKRWGINVTTLLPPPRPQASSRAGSTFWSPFFRRVRCG